MSAESDLHKALAAVGESAPERPTYADYHDGTDAVRSYASELEALALRLAVRLERAERKAQPPCLVCRGEQKRLYTFAGGAVVGECDRCNGTGKEQGR